MSTTDNAPRSSRFSTGDESNAGPKRKPEASNERYLIFANSAKTDDGKEFTASYGVLQKNGGKSFRIPASIMGTTLTATQALELADDATISISAMVKNRATGRTSRVTNVVALARELKPHTYTTEDGQKRESLEAVVYLGTPRVKETDEGRVKFGLQIKRLEFGKDEQGKRLPDGPAVAFTNSVRVVGTENSVQLSDRQLFDLYEPVAAEVAAGQGERHASGAELSTMPRAKCNIALGKVAPNLDGKLFGVTFIDKDGQELSAPQANISVSPIVAEAKETPEETVGKAYEALTAEPPTAKEEAPTAAAELTSEDIPFSLDDIPPFEEEESAGVSQG